MSRDAMRSATPTAVWTGFQRWSRRSPRRYRRFSKRKVLTGVKMDLEISAFERLSTSPLTRATLPRAQAGTGLMNRRRGYQGHQAGGKIMATTVDVIVIGTGTAAQTVAYACREAGWSVAVIDSRPFGGTCQLRGCDPKKVLVGISELVYWSHRMHGTGGSAPSPSIIWPKLIR